MKIIHGLTSSTPLIAVTALCLAGTAFHAWADPTVRDNTISWPDDGWYQVQDATTFESVCEGGRSCTVEPGLYTVINHTTGERFESISVDDITAPPSTVSVSGQTISWPDNGWYQVQNAQTFAEICSGARSCTVAPGEYIVINHTTGERYESVVVEGDSSSITVTGNTISWADDGWHQVQRADTFGSVCEGGRSCTVEPGIYIVINHTNGRRFEGIEVASHAIDVVSPATVNATASTAPIGVRRVIDLTPVTPPEGYRSLSIDAMSTDAESPLLVLRQFLINEGDSGELRYVGLNVNSGVFRSLLDRFSTLSSPDLSRDGRYVAWLEGSSCNLYYQGLQPLTDPQRINDLLPEFSCPRPPTVSANGDIIVFSEATGRLSDDGELFFDRFDPDDDSIVIVRPGNGRVIDLALNRLPLGDAELDALARTLRLEAISHDGRHVVFRAFFLPRELPETGLLPNYVVGTLLANTETGEITLLNRNRYERFYSRRVPPGGEDGSTISGDGRIAWYVQSKVKAVGRDAVPTTLQRLDTLTGVITSIDVPGVKSQLHSSDDGMRLTFRLDGEVVVYRHATQDLVRTTQALRFCDHPTEPFRCEFESVRYVRDDPASISGDGRAILIQTIPERAGIDTPQNTMELFLLDVDAATLQRVEENRDVSWAAITPSADRILYLHPQADDGTFLSRNRLFQIDR